MMRVSAESGNLSILAACQNRAYGLDILVEVYRLMMPSTVLMGRVSLLAGRNT